MTSLLRAPDFWQKRYHPFTVVLMPLSWIYAAIADRRMRAAKGASLPVPVICVGNFTAGGAGKSPTVEALVHAARSLGHKPGIVMRGFGGQGGAAQIVEAGRDKSGDVGDEALMLSAVAPVAVSPRRHDAADLLVQAGVNMIIMDDGLQSGRLKPDLALAVIDRKRGLGNGLVLPAGPLRASLAVQLEKTDRLILVGADQTGNTAALVAQTGLAALDAAIRPRDAARFSGRRVLAFAGIGYPEKFFDTLRAAGAEIVKAVPLADHQAIAPDTARAICADAEATGLAVVTTAKDMARLEGAADPALQALATAADVLEIDMVFAEAEAAKELVATAVERFSRRMGASKTGFNPN
ncbi:tetraacyldisaccharide 4'-kinase [Martelella alba]|uniref:Tetraacyldisaccharide 4'-kinase n=1 Tax=Martelella alba TaxID=2590451 RepID=A0A506UBU4_9HYPH|nr:tetraacyldisaccharide 4'-kinase [Martelella alba]TPW30866.1 tetraacyldisaccharide 4'-kinase [Martelella alba]